MSLEARGAGLSDITVQGAALGLYGWALCSTGQRDRTLLGGLVFVLLGGSAMLWAPIAGLVVRGVLGVRGVGMSMALGGLGVAGAVVCMIFGSWRPLLWCGAAGGLGVGMSSSGVAGVLGMKELGCAVGLAHAAVAVSAFAEVRRQAREVAGVGECGVCRYPIAELERCPECGTPVGRAV